MLNRIYKLVGLMTLTVLLSVFSIAQDTQVRNVVAGQKMKIKGVVVSKDTDKIIVRDTMGVDTKVTVTTTDIKTKGGVFGGGDRVAASQIVRGLNLEIEGVGDGSGNLVANKVRFSKTDLKTAQSIDSRVSPAEERISQAEENAQRLSGQIDELVAVSNAARGGAKAAQDSADAAIAGVNATNQRISALDDYQVQTTATVNFTVGSSILTPEGKAQLDQVAQQALALRGYTIEVTGFTDASGSPQKNKVLSQKRAQAVIDYLIETHNIPLRRIGQSYGFGENQAIADNATREGRTQNRRVEVKLLVSRGLNQNVEVKKDEATPNQ
jgi:outer membrane protein OmpA-like peptidoglycan-associated protein